MKMNSKEAYKKIIEAHNDMRNHFEVNETEVFEGFAVIGIALDRLEKLEKIEEELGIDLLTLFEAVKNGIIEAADLKYKQEYRTFPSIIWTDPTDNFKETEYEKNYEGFCLYDDNYGNYFYFVDYGKTWALTREVLENETNNKSDNCLQYY